MDDVEELIRAQGALIKQLRRGCRLRATLDGAYDRIQNLKYLFDGMRKRRSEYMAENRRLRSLVPAEKSNVVFEDDREVIQLDSDDDE